MNKPPHLLYRRGRLLECREARADYTLWSVDVEGETGLAAAYPSLCGPLHAGDEVWLNTTAVALGLGSGGLHFVLARCTAQEMTSESFPGREAGHILKLRYTPLQHRVLATEEPASPHHAALREARTLQGTRVVATDVHSQAISLALAAHAAAPDLRLVLVHLDSAALPLALSRLVHDLRRDGVLAATVTVGQSFGGDYEAVNVYSGLQIAREVAGADLILVTQGPGNVGTSTELGFSGLSLAEALHAADFLEGTPVLAPRMSSGDPRPEHRGLSHHSRTVLRCLRVPVTVPIPRTGPDLAADPDPLLQRHRWITADPDPWLPALEPYRSVLTTMGRTLDQDPLFFAASVAAGAWAALHHAGDR